MYRKLLSLFLCTLVFNATEAQTEAFIAAGLQLTPVRYKVRGRMQDSDAGVGGRLSFGVNVPFENRLLFTPSFSYQFKGYDARLKDQAYPPGEDAIATSVHYHSVELAPLLQINFPANNQTTVFIRFGPALDIGVSGNEKITIDTGGTIKRKLPFSFGDYNRFIFSGQFFVGTRTEKGLFISLFYNQGLTSFNNADGGPVIRQRIMGVTAGKVLTLGKRR
jgi:hypothetical protein